MRKIKNRKELKKGTIYITKNSHSVAVLEKQDLPNTTMIVVDPDGSATIYETEYLGLTYVRRKKIRELESKNSSRHGYVWANFPFEVKEYY